MYRQPLEIPQPGPTEAEKAVLARKADAERVVVDMRKKLADAEAAYARDEEGVGEKVLNGASAEKLGTRLRTLAGAVDMAKRALKAAEDKLTEEKGGLKEAQRKAEAQRYALAADELEANYRRQVEEIQSLQGKQLERDGAILYRVENPAPHQIEAWRREANVLSRGPQKHKKGRDVVNDPNGPQPSAIQW